MPHSSISLCLLAAGLECFVTPFQGHAAFLRPGPGGGGIAKLTVVRGSVPPQCEEARLDWAQLVRSAILALRRNGVGVSRVGPRHPVLVRPGFAAAESM